MSSGDNGDNNPVRPPANPIKKKQSSGVGGAGGDNVSGECGIVEETKVNSPDRTVAATLRTGDVLRLHYEPGPPKRLLARTDSGAVLGSITSPSMPQFI